MGEPQPGDWVTKFPEPGQTFHEWQLSNPVTITSERDVICIQRIGDFTPAQRRVVDLTADLMARYFTLEVRFLDDLPLAEIPAHARRVHPEWGDRQILSTYVLHEVLAPRLPGDAACAIALTGTDLWPGEGWNFVFGQASLRDRVGVWSIYRNGDPSRDEDAFRLCLRRTCRVATHETGHMFSLAHCIAYACNMCGSNSLEESDRRALPCCPECVAKICAATGAEPLPRFRRLHEFCIEQGLAEDAAIYGRSVGILAGSTDD
jgi:archaemetzincin